ADHRVYHREVDEVQRRRAVIHELLLQDGSDLVREGGAVRAEEVEEDGDLHGRICTADPWVGIVIDVDTGGTCHEAGNDGESCDDQDYGHDGDHHETLRVHEPESTERHGRRFVLQDAR